MQFSDSFGSALPRISTAYRLLLAAGGTCLLVVLGIAVYLKPDPRGLGTHRQLGLPPCTFVEIVGKPCPSCGMTTAFSNTVRGRLWTAARCNVGGVMLALTSMAMGPWMLISAAKGAWWIGPLSDRLLLWGGIAVVGVTIVEWLIKLLAT